MSTPDPTHSSDPEGAPVMHRDQLVQYLEQGCKPPERFQQGLEEERFVYRSEDHSPALYDGPKPGIRALLEAMARFGWSPIHENGLPIGLSCGGSSVTVEPAGQLEFSGAPVGSVHEIAQQVQAYHRQVASVARELGLCFLMLGYQPKTPRAQLPWVPKRRYEIMRSYMLERGALALDMMQGTCALQWSADFSSEADMVKKFRVALALQPLVTALFASSPFKEGRLSGYLSYRSHVWTDTDGDRCGSLPFVFEEGMGFERYADYALDVPMYFVRRSGRYIDAAGLSFRDFLAGRLAVLPGERPVLGDWVDHLSTIFPQVRLKRYLELRGADAVSPLTRSMALPALWAGLLYDSDALGTAWERIRDWEPEERQRLESEVARGGLHTPFRKGTVRELCLWMLDLSHAGLQRRACRDEEGANETRFLETLRETAERGQTPAEDLIRRFKDEWREDIDRCVQALCRETLT